MQSSLQAISRHFCPPRARSGYLRSSLAAKAAVGEAEHLPARRTERAGSWKPSLVLRRRLGCVSPFRGIKQVSPFRGQGLPSLQALLYIPRILQQMPCSPALCCNGAAEINPPALTPPNFFSGQALPDRLAPQEEGAGTPPATQYRQALESQSLLQQWYPGSIGNWYRN